MFKVLVLCVIFEIATAAVCPSSPFTQAIQDSILAAHNNYRSELAKGLSFIKGGALASGAKNMYKFTYDCTMEQTAQTLANKCLGLVHSTAAELQAINAGENLYWNNLTSAFVIQQSMTLAINGWWNELALLGGITPTDVKFTTAMAPTLGHWTQMAWGKTTSVGCAFKACATQNINMIVCHYKSYGNILGADIYERGTGCAADTDCTTLPNSKCDVAAKLCYIGDTVTTNTTTTTTTTTTTVGGWTEWTSSTCTANCGLCGRVVKRRVCRGASCPGSATLLTTTPCGSPSFCVFGLGLPSCCEPAKRAVVNGAFTCA